MSYMIYTGGKSEVFRSHILSYLSCLVWHFKQLDSEIATMLSEVAEEMQ